MLYSYYSEVIGNQLRIQKWKTGLLISILMFCILVEQILYMHICTTNIQVIKMKPKLPIRTRWF